jgi:hypothetical protein
VYGLALQRVSGLFPKDAYIRRAAPSWQGRQTGNPRYDPQAYRKSLSFASCTTHCSPSVKLFLVIALQREILQLRVSIESSRRPCLLQFNVKISQVFLVRALNVSDGYPAQPREPQQDSEITSPRIRGCPHAGQIVVLDRQFRGFPGGGPRSVGLCSPGGSHGFCVGTP